jgi:hypothetical protein
MTVIRNHDEDHPEYAGSRESCTNCGFHLTYPFMQWDGHKKKIFFCQDCSGILIVDFAKDLRRLYETQRDQKVVFITTKKETPAH